MIGVSINYEKVREENKKKRNANSWGLRLIPYLYLICSLRKLNWRHREILQFLFEEFGDLNKFNEMKPIQPEQLSNIIGKWKARNLIDFSLVDKEIAKIEGKNSEQKEDFF